MAPEDYSLEDKQAADCGGVGSGSGAKRPAASPVQRKAAGDDGALGGGPSSCNDALLIGASPIGADPDGHDLSAGGGEFKDAEFSKLNYFNYLTEVEDEFVRRRRSHLMISPMDWALVESWKDAGVPLHIVLRGISKAFDGYDARDNHFRKVNSVLYCQQAVEESFAEYRLSQVGAQVGAQAQTEASSDTSAQTTAKGKKSRKQGSGFSKEAVLGFLDGCQAALQSALDRTTAALRPKESEVPAQSSQRQAVDVLERASDRLRDIRQSVESAPDLNAESLERDLDSIDRMLLEKLKEAFGGDKLVELANEAKGQLRKYKKNMDKEMYEQTVNNFIERRIREHGGVPRLSLFYMS